MAVFSDGKGVIYGNLADRPSATAQNNGVQFLAVDTGAHYISSGSAWVLIWTGGATPQFSGARVHQTGGGQSLTNNTVTPITFDAEDFDTDNYHDNVTNNSRLTVPATGYYRIAATAGFQSSNVGGRQWRLVINNSRIVALRNLNTTANGGDYSSVEAGPVNMTATDYAELQMYQNTGVGLALVVAAEYSPYLAIQRVG